MLIRRFDRYGPRQSRCPAAGKTFSARFQRRISREAFGVCQRSYVLACDEMESRISPMEIWHSGSTYCHPRDTPRTIASCLSASSSTSSSINDDFISATRPFVWDPRLPDAAESAVRCHAASELAPERRLHLGVGPQDDRNPRQCFAGREMFTLSAEAAGREHRQDLEDPTRMEVSSKVQVPSHQIRGSHRHFGTLTISRRGHCVG